MYIATSNWSGLSITEMRSFETLAGALAYVRQLVKQKHYFNPQPEWFRVYEVFTHDKPRLVKLTKDDLTDG